MNQRDEQGFFTCDGQFIEKTRIDKQAQLTATHAFLAESFSVMAELARTVGKKADAVAFEKNAEEICSLIQNDFWDAGNRLFNDGYKNGRLHGRYYPISNALPLLFGCTDKNQAESILAYLEEQMKDIGENPRDRRLTAYGSFYVLASLYKNERADAAERFIRRYWAPMILKGNDTSWEYFDIKAESEGGGGGTSSHAWSAHPTYFLSSEVLGVHLGFQNKFDRNVIVIAPQSATLSWAKGIVPHPLGLVKVEWKIEGEHLFLEYAAPSGAKVIVKPRGRLAQKTLWVNGVCVDKKEE